MQRRRLSFAALSLVVAAACGVHTSQNGAVQITSVNPTTGSLTGGSAVTIQGLGLDDGSHHVTLTFGTSVADVTSVTDNTIVATVPAGLACGASDVEVTNNRGVGFKQHAYTYTGGSGAITVTGITPTFGVLAGGTQVTITGTGFSGGVGVTIGGVALKHIVVTGDTTITGDTAPGTSGGTLDVVVRNCGSQGGLTQGFSYTTGLIGGVVDMNLTEYPAPGQFATPTPRNYTDPFISFVDPQASTLLGALPASGQCVISPAASTPPPVTRIDAGTSLDLKSGAKSMTLQFQTADGGYDYAYDSMGNLTTEHFNNATQFATGGSYEISATGGAVPAFDVVGAFDTPTEYTMPASFTAATPTTITKTNALAVTWTGGTAGTMFVIELDGYASGTLTKYIICNAPDTGSFTVPGSTMTTAFGGTATNAIVWATNRRLESNFVLPSNGSTVEVVSSLYKVGAFFAN